MAQRTLPKIRCSRGPLGELLSAQRRRRGLSISELARLAGITPGRAQEFEIGRYAPRRQTLARLLQALDVPQEYVPLLRTLARVDVRLQSLQRELASASRHLFAGELPALISLDEGQDPQRASHEDGAKQG
ncbi:MAG: helix-turn-helix domain-containing protein [Candidatus Methylomirabilales bacterium]